MQLVQSHFYPGLFLAQGLMAQRSVLGCPGGALPCGSSPLLRGVPGQEPLSRGWGVQVGLGCWPDFGVFLPLGCVRAACRAMLAGFAFSQICSPGGTNLLHRAVREKLSKVSAL